MKRILKFIMAFSLGLVLLLGNANLTYGASASLTGPSTVRAGDTITLYLNISDSGKYGVEGTISYDSSQVTLQSASSNVGGWKYENNGSSFVLYDDQLSSPLGGSQSVLVLSFNVNSGVAAGTTVSISVSGIITTDGSTENSLGTANYSLTIAQPLSGNANLASLSVSGHTLSPAFSSGTTSYSLGEVEYTTSSLSVSATPEDGKASVSVSGTSLAVGNNTVTITVTAENGATKTYKISVTRKQDPNYVPSANASLAGISVSAGTISPGFSAEVTDYIVYLPYESVGTAFTASGTAADSKAQGVTAGTIDALVEGVNTTTVVCKAEDGTAKTYTITVVVMPQYLGAIPLIEGVEVVEPDEPIEEMTTEVDSTEFEEPSEDKGANEGVSWVLMLILGLVIGAGLGVGGVYLYNKYVRKEDDKTIE